MNAALGVALVALLVIVGLALLTRAIALDLRDLRRRGTSLVPETVVKYRRPDQVLANGLVMERGKDGQWYVIANRRY